MISSSSGAHAQLAELIEVGTRERVHGNAVEAERILREAAMIAETSFQHDAVTLAAALNSLGLVLKDLARYDEARTLYERALSLLDPNTNGGEITALYHNLGGIEHARRNFAEAEGFARAGIELRHRLGSVDEPALAADMVALAAILDGQRKFEEAEPIYIEALNVLERSPDSNAGDIAVALNDLGAHYAQRGDSQRAEEFLGRAVDIKTRTMGSEHPDVAVTLNNLALVHKRRSDFHRAREIYQNALRIFERSLGADHPKTVACRRNRDRCLADPNHD